MGSCFGSSEMPVVGFFFLILFGVSAVAHHVGEGVEDFISIDCGFTGNSSYEDEITGIPYAADDLDAGESHNISADYLNSSLPRRLQTLRSFPSGARNCYTLKQVLQYEQYLIRATFMHGNYDGGAHPLQFDLHIDVNFCKTVNVTDASTAYVVEVIVVALADLVSVCLINTGSGTPFISVLELRPAEDTLYSYLNASQYLVLFARVDLGTLTDKVVRYPQDRYDRIWEPFSSWSERLSFRPSSLDNIATDSNVTNDPSDLNHQFEAPSAVMQTAAVPANSTTLEFHWDFAGSGAPVNQFYANLLFSELLPSTSRAFDVYLNGNVSYPNVRPRHLISDTMSDTSPLTPSPRYQWALNSTGLSTLPPILNALEVYRSMYLTDVPTDSGDVNAIMAIRDQYKVKRNWMGDACTPRNYSWEGLNCSSHGNPSRIVAINLSSSALTGDISSSFAMLYEIEYLDLSFNNLTGQIPDNLGDLSSLRVLNLTGNNLTGEIPASLLQKSQESELIFRFQDNPYLCTDVTSCESAKGRSKKIATPIIVIICLISVLLLLVVIFVVWRLRQSPGTSSKVVRSHRDNPLQLENRQFTYEELEKITNNFKDEIGKGGFGTVYHGHLEDGTQVAVKLRSQSSSQGTKEFLAEAQTLIRIHHKNLVSLVGYCMDGDHLALVYEFMSLGSLKEHLRDKTRSATALSWGQRLKIAVEAAQGLEYLHKGCKPPLVHRDVKTSNILLSDSLEAKIADFGLSKSFQNDVDSHVSTNVVGTPGYLDPEYYFTYQLSEKSDVYSFGVVLLELITGQPPVLTVPRNTSLVQWAQQGLASGNIEDVVDANLRNEYDVNSIWKAADIAFRCTSRISHQRPSMTDVVLELQESLTLETAREISEFPSMSSKNLDTENTGMSQAGEFGVEYFTGISPAAR